MKKVLSIHIAAMSFLVLLIFATTPFTVVQASSLQGFHSSNKSEGIQHAKLPEKTISSSRTDAPNDAATQLFMNTTWKTDIFSENEIAIHNSTVDFYPESAPSMAAPPMVPAKSYENGTSLESYDSLTQSTATSYFSGHSWTWEYDTDNRHVEAPPVARCLEGNWFPKASYSRIIYQASVTDDTTFHFRVERGADTYARYFRLYLGRHCLKEHTIERNDDYYSAEVDVPNGWASGSYYIILEINFGGHVDKGWYLKHWRMTQPDGEGYNQYDRTDYQQFRKEHSSELVFDVAMGPDTKLHIETENCHDPFDRYIYIYVGGMYVTRVLSPGSFTVDLLDIGSPIITELKLLLEPGDFWYGYYPKSLKQLYVSYHYLDIECDSMSNHQQPGIVFDRVESYYQVHDYRRISFHVDETNIPYDNTLHYSEVDALYNNHFDHMGQDRWAWGLFGHYVAGAWGWAQFNYQRFVIGDETSEEFMPGESLEDKRVWIIMHEFGHTQAMDDYTGYKTDVYADDQYGWNYIDWTSPHYACSSWRDRLEWVVTEY
ncbi:MAG: hypothetical protein GF309_08435 [Candidatus Lokiarchaeota archaeon]|nr:hypothetical protein [Candidatus Lokiarchaeota archaeon]